MPDPADTTPATEAPPEPRPFATFLMEHARGKSHDELSRRLQELIEAIDTTGKGGTLTYRLTVKPAQKADHAVVVTDEIKLSAPSLDRPASIFFVDDRYSLVRNDPRQLTLDRMTED